MLKPLVEALRGIVVVAEHGLEPHAGLAQRAIGFLELAAIVFGRGRPFVDVVADHQHQREREALVVGRHPAGDVVLRLPAAAAVADHRELDRCGSVGQGQPVRRAAPQHRLVDADGALGRGVTGTAGGRKRHQRR